MAYPTPKVEIAFVSNPNQASPTWTDVTSYVRSMRTDRGRSDDWGTFSGTAELVLDNRTRRFDPFNSSGPYYNYLLPRNQIRIQATVGSTTYPVFRGYVSGWPVAWDEAGNNSTVTISCYDALQYMAACQLPNDWGAIFALLLNPDHFYILNEPITPYTSGQTFFDSSTTSRTQSMTSTALAFPGGQLAPGIASSSLAGFFTDTYLATAGSSVGTNYMNPDSMTFMCWFDHPAGTSATDVVLEGGFADWYYSFVVENSDANPNCVVVSFADQTDTYTMYATYKDMSFGPHHLAVTINRSSSNAIKIYIDGIEVTGTRQRTSGSVLRPPEYIAVANGPVSHILVKAGLISQANIKEYIEYCILARKETTGSRIGLYTLYAPFPSSSVTVPSTPSANCLELAGPNTYILPALQKVADTEGAPLWVTSSGTLTMWKSNQVFTTSRSTTSQAAFGGTNNIPLDPSVKLYYDADSMRNYVINTMSQGGIYTISDSTSITKYGQSTINTITEAATIADADVSSDIVLTLGKDVYPALTPFRVGLTPGAQWSEIMALDLMDRVTVTIVPPTGSQLQFPLITQRIMHDVVPGQWNTTLEGSNRWAQSYS